MRTDLFYNPLMLLERLGQWATEQSRLRQLRGTVAEQLQTGHIDSLELLQLLRPLSPSVIYDIGANVGTWTLLAKATFPGAQIHAFEPYKNHCQEYSERTRGLRGVTLHEYAIGSASGQGELRLLNRSDASSLLPMTEACRDQYNLREVSKLSVPVITLDHMRRDHNLPPPDLVKLDIQGLELDALRGGSDTLAQTSAILTEVSFLELYNGQCLFDGLVIFLAKKGFHVFAFGRSLALGEPLLQADVLFVSQAGEQRLRDGLQ